MSLDVLCLRRPKINYVSPPVCEAIFSGSGIPIIVLEPFNVLTKITGIVVIRDGNTRIISWPAYPGAICYNVYQQQPDGSYVLIAECIEDPTITLPPGLPIIITPITPDGEGDVSDPIDINGGGGGGGCVTFIDDVGTNNLADLPNLISRINGMVIGIKNFPGPVQRPWRYFDRVASDIRTIRSSGVVTASQSASDLVNTDGTNFFLAGDVGKFLKFDSGGDAREIIAFISPTQVQVATVDTVASSTFSVRGQTIGGDNGGADITNGAGHIVGNESDPAFNSRTFWFNSNTGEFRDLGDFLSFIPIALNENGFLLYNNGTDNAIYDPGTQLSTVIPGVTLSDFNQNLLAAGQRLIDFFPMASEIRAVKWQGGVTTDINPPEASTGSGTFSDANRVNESGLIFGRFLQPFGDSTTRTRVFVHNGGVSSSIGFFHPGTSAATGWVVGEDLNEAGMLVGGADIEGITGTGISRGFKWTAGTGIVQLDVLPGQPDSYAEGVNEAGFIVGSSGTRAVIWRPGQLVPEDLNNFLPPASGWVLNSARAITNENEVIGNGLFNGDFKNFFLKLCL